MPPFRDDSSSMPFGPTNMFEMFVGPEVPDPITFVLGQKWLNRPHMLYPRQATLLKIIFLRDDLMTEYDLAVIKEWEENYRLTGNNGISPKIMERIAWLKERKAKWFREVLLVMGRRAGKGYVSGVAISYVLWNYIALGNPQSYYGIDRDKRLSTLIFAGKRDQAKATVYGDVVNAISSSECFAPYISRSQTESLTLYVPSDFQRIMKMKKRGINTYRDLASLEVLPKESTPMAGRGPSSMVAAFDEMAHVTTGSGTTHSADAVYCLDSHTLVMVADGSQKPISDVEKGDEVFAVDEQYPEWGTFKTKVVNKWVFERTSYFSIICKDERVLKCSGNHMWYTQRGWTRTDELKEGDFILDVSSIKFGVAVAKVSFHHDPVTLVDIETEAHTFIAEGLATHNTAVKPSLDQFGQDAFLIEPSSPWQMMGQFYDNYIEAMALDDEGFPTRPNYLAIQLASWDMYRDWERSTEIPVFPEGYEGDLGEYRDQPHPHFPKIHKPIQIYDDEMRREKAANPESFAVEREAHWAAAVDAYLNAEKVDDCFAPWLERPSHYGPPQIEQQASGILALTYLAHADPSKVNDKFGYCLGHKEIDAEGRSHCVIDKVGHFDPADFPDHIIDYSYVDEWLWDNLITKFYPEEFTFDQYSSGPSIQKFNARIREHNLPKRVVVYERPVTRPKDWEEKENAKAAINMGLVHIPENLRLKDEMKFVQLVNGRVDHPNSGPVQSKDIFDSLCSVIDRLIGHDVKSLIADGLSSFKPSFSTMGEPFPQMSQGGGDSVIDQLRFAQGTRQAPSPFGGGARPQRRSQW